MIWEHYTHLMHNISALQLNCFWGGHFVQASLKESTILWLQLEQLHCRPVRPQQIENLWESKTHPWILNCCFSFTNVSSICIQALTCYCQGLYVLFSKQIQELDQCDTLKERVKSAAFFILTEKCWWGDGGDAAKADEHCLWEMIWSAGETHIHT